MTQLAPITLDNGAVIYVETSDDVVTPDVPVQTEPEEDSREEKGAVEDVQKAFQAMKGTI